jgi:hypothetical protein
MNNLFKFMNSTTILKKLGLWQDFFFFLPGKLKGESFKDHKAYVQELDHDAFTDKESPSERVMALRSFTIAIVIAFTLMTILLLVPLLLIIPETAFSNFLVTCIIIAGMDLCVLFAYFSLRSFPAYLYAYKIKNEYPDDHQIKAKPQHVFYNIEFLILCPILIISTSILTFIYLS